MALIENDSDVMVSTANVTVDREACPKYWIAIYTRPKSEKKASSILNLIGIKTYIPIQTEIRQWSDRKKVVEVVIIPNIIFAYIRDRDINSIRQIHLVTKFVSVPGCKKPAPIPAVQIERLKFMLRESESTVSFRSIDFKKHDAVKVIRGKLKGLTGVVEKLSPTRSLLIVFLDLLGGAMVEIDSRDLEPVKL